MHKGAFLLSELAFVRKAFVGWWNLGAMPSGYWGLSPSHHSS